MYLVQKYKVQLSKPLKKHVGFVKPDIFFVIEPISCLDVSYGAWSNCTAACDEGTKSRNLSCIKGDQQLPLSECGLTTNEATATCKVQPCLTEWSNWGQCSVTCGRHGGTKERTRTCNDPSGNCTGSTSELADCNATIPVCTGNWHNSLYF